MNRPQSDATKLPEAMRSLRRKEAEVMGNGVGFSSAASEALIMIRNEARAACLAAMLRPEPDDICCLGFKDANECRCHREEQASAEKAGEYRETGWLVENGMPSDIKYRFMDDDGPQWTRDPLKAIRFARRADAEMFAAGDDDAWRIVEHVFLSPPAAREGGKP